MDECLCRKARENKDLNYDGKFYIGVKSTGIFCRVACPANPPKEENVIYFSNIYEALDNGLRPCLRCMPDFHAKEIEFNKEVHGAVKDAVALINDGYLNTNSVAELAEEINVSERHLRKLFLKEINISPSQLGVYHKIIFAKKMLVNTDMSVTNIAFASGFGSIRQFNYTFKKIFKTTPSQYRSKRYRGNRKGSTIFLGYDKGFDFSRILEFMRVRAIKGVEYVDEDSYTRSFRLYGIKGHFTVGDNKREKRLELNIYSDDMRCYMSIYRRVRKMFDLESDLKLISEALNDEILIKGFINDSVPRMPVAFNPYEFTIRAILGQQITVKAATTLAARIAQKCNVRYDSGMDEIRFFFPDADEIDSCDLDGIGITKTRVRTIENVNRAFLNREFSLEHKQEYEDFYSKFTAIKGIGDWTANYIAMRGLGMEDAFPAGDLGVIKALTLNGKKPKIKEIKEVAEKWRPYRSYATLCLWYGLE